MSEIHLPPLVLEEIVTGARPRTDPQVAIHLDACASCRDRLEQLESETEAYLQRRPPAAFAARVSKCHRAQSRARRRNWALGAALATAAAAAIAWVGLAGPREPTESPDVRLRGGAVVQALAVRAGTLVPVAPETVLRAGTKLRFRIQTRRAHICIYHRLGDALTLLHPTGRATMPPAEPWLIPGTFALTATAARDYLVIAHLSGPFDCRARMSGVRRRLDRSETLDGASVDLELVVAPLPRARVGVGEP
jgi:hypothetical protein